MKIFHFSLRRKWNRGNSNQSFYPENKICSFHKLPKIKHIDKENKEDEVHNAAKCKFVVDKSKMRTSAPNFNTTGEIPIQNNKRGVLSPQVDRSHRYYSIPF